MKFLDMNGLISVLSKLLTKVSTAFDGLEERVTANETAIDGKADTEHSHTKAEITDFPASMKNPNALTVKVGDVTSTYDGSDAVTVSVEAVMEEEINDAIKELYVNNYDGSEGQLNMLIELSGGLSETVNVGDDANVYICNNGDAYLAGSGDMDNYDYYTRPFNNNVSIGRIYILNGVTSIGNYAFCGCKSLTSVTIGNSVTSIGDYAFQGSSLTSIKISDSVTSIGDYAFGDCNGLTSVTIPDSVTSIGDYAFMSCNSLTLVILGDSVTSIGNYAFNDCTSLTSVTIPDSVTSIGGGAFSGCASLTSVTIGNSVTSIGDYAFKDCASLTSATIGNSVTSIGDRAFIYCTNLATITIPDSVTSIGSFAFRGCTNLATITINKAQGSITGSPWGATGAEVIWTGGE